MSKRNRGRRAARPVQSQPEKKPAIRRAVPLLAMDGYINRLAYLGEASLLNEANDYERHSITRDVELLTVMYRENWIAKRIIDTPCEDMTRSWYTISSALDQDRIDEIVQLEGKHNVKQEITNALRWARLYGGAAAVIVVKGQEDMLDTPLNYDEMMPGCFRGLIVVDRTSGLDPSIELEEDMDDPEFGYPKWYTVRIDNEQTVRVHHSRMLLFRGRMLPILEEQSESYWGASELEHVYEELQKRNATSANIAQLVFQANVGVLKMADYGEILGMGTEAQRDQIVESIYTQNRIRNSFGMMIMGNDDGFEQHPYSFSGLSEVYESFMMDMAGAAEIPATKLYGRSPQGMNATGESDMKNYYEMLAQLQERNLRPAIEKLLPVMAMSLWGKIPNDMQIVFEPLQITTPAERAQITQQVTGVVIQAFSAGLISQQTALMELQKAGKDIGSWTSITDDLVENAETEVDNGEGEQDPMGGMGGMMGMGGPGGPEGAPPEGGGPGDMPQEAPEGPEAAPGGPDDQMLAKMMEGAQGGEEDGKQPALEAGGMSSPDGENAPDKATPEKPKVQEEQEAKDDSLKRDPRKAKFHRQIMKAAKRGDLETARELVRMEKRYLDMPEGSRKPHRSGLRDALASVLKPFRRKGADEEIWRTSEEGRHFKLETETGEIKAGFGGRFNGKKVGEQWGPGSGSKPRAKGSRVAAPPKSAPVKPKTKDIPMSFNETSTGHMKSKQFADASRADYEESRKEAKEVFGNVNSSKEEKEQALNYLAATASSSDAWHRADRGDAPVENGFGLGKAPKEWTERLTPAEQQVLANICSVTDELDYINLESWAKKNPEASDVQMALQAKFLGADVDVDLSDDILQKYAGIEKREEIPGQQSMFWGENVPGSDLEIREARSTGISSGSSPGDSGYVPYDDLSSSHKAVFDQYKKDFVNGKSVYKTAKSSEHFPGTKEFAERQKKAARGKASYPSEFGISQNEVNEKLSDAIRNNSALYRFNGDGTLRIIVKSDKIIGKCVSAETPKGTETRWFMSTVKRTPSGWEHHEYPCREEG